MTQIADIDVKEAVTKFLGKDTSSTGMLESIATAFLLNPQLALSFILKARNKLQAIATKQAALITSVLSSLQYVNRPDIPITSTEELTNARVALIQLDRMGKLNNSTLEGYESSINNFLNENLNRSRSGLSTEFALTQIEAKEDVYIGLAGFILYHRQIIELINSLLSSMDDFKSVELDKIVSSRIVQRIRDSVEDVSNNVEDLSKVSMVLELLAGKASLSSVAKPRKIDDPIVETNVVPSGTKVQVISERIAATATSGVLPITAMATTLRIGINGVVGAALEYPRPGAGGRAFITSKTANATFNIPAGRKLYIQIFYNAPVLGPLPQLPGGPTDVIHIPLTSGVRSFSQVSSEIHAGLETFNTFLGMTRYGNCASFVKDGTNILIIYSPDPNITGYRILGDIPGYFDMMNNYVSPNPSIHETLGFLYNQDSTPANKILSEELNTFISLSYNTITSTHLFTDNKIQVTSNNITEASSLGFEGICIEAGFPGGTIVPIPTYLGLRNTGIPVSGDSLDIHPGYQILMTGSTYIVTSIDQDKLFVDIAITPIPLTDIKIYSDVYIAITKLLTPLKASFRTIFDNDIFNVEQVVGPILTSNPSLAQVGNCTRVFNGVLTNVQQLVTLLNTYKLDNPTSTAEDIAKEIVFMLETKNMNNLVDLLNSCKFKEFFSTSIDAASTSTNLMSAVEEIGRNDLIVEES